MELKTIIYTVLALMAFAGNSILCRLALGGGHIDAVGFTSYRLLSGAITLIFLLILRNKKPASLTFIFQPSAKNFLGATLLFIYAICFSLAYVELDAGSGALILFGAVQLTMLLSGQFTSERPVLLEWFGVVLSFVGLVYLLLPSWGTPALTGFALMAISGIAWGLYTLIGRGSAAPLLETSKNFTWSVPLLIMLNFIALDTSSWSQYGLVLAITSGAITSGLGYAIWYAVLPKLKSTQAGVIQLLVPIMAAFGGVLLLNEPITARLMVSGVVVLSGIYWVMILGCPKSS